MEFTSIASCCVFFFVLVPLMFFVNTFAIMFGGDLAIASVKSLVKTVTRKKAEKKVFKGSCNNG